MIQLTKDIIAVEVEPNTSDYHFKYDPYFEILYLKYSLIGVNNKVCELKEVEVPLNSKQIIGVTPLSEEQWKEVVETKVAEDVVDVYFQNNNSQQVHKGRSMYKHYQREYLYFTDAIRSGLSLLESKGLDVNKKYAIIKIEK